MVLHSLYYVWCYFYILMYLLEKKGIVCDMEQITSFSAPDRSPFDYAPNGAKTRKDVDNRCCLQLFGSNLDHCCWPQCERSFSNATGEEGCKSAYIMVYCICIIGSAFAF